MYHCSGSKYLTLLTCVRLRVKVRERDSYAFNPVINHHARILTFTCNLFI